MGCAQFLRTHIPGEDDGNTLSTALNNPLEAIDFEICPLQSLTPSSACEWHAIYLRYPGALTEWVREVRHGHPRRHQQRLALHLMTLLSLALIK
jgi:hypothetical protein